MNKVLAAMMDKQLQYNVSMSETHHTEKKDAPSGTAITLAEGIIQELGRKQAWKLVGENPGENEIGIAAIREEGVPGTHVVNYSSEVDSIEIIHTAHSRKGFAEGAVKAAEWLKGKQGIFGMDDMLQL